ncbi:MAG: carbohydrate kinase family protein [Candidatus Wolfebacteria bacterium]|nr:carbohydrate kinase family protein [Candidatus Wolfebacteria bacterium]
MFDIITIGTATKDVFLRSPFFKILKDPEHLKKIGFPSGEAQCFALGGKVEVDEPVFMTGGGATNTAVTFSRQGFKTAALIKIGEDDSGEEILSELEKEGIKIFAVKDKKIPTGYDTILLSSGGERTILVYRGAGDSWDIKDIPLRKLKARWAYIVPGNIPFDVVEYLIGYLSERGVSIAINPSKKLIQKGLSGLKNILSKSQVVILNREEASYLTGADYGDKKKIFSVLDEAVKGIIVMTDGANGLEISDGFKIYEAGIFKEREVVDRTGAGDAFGSGFVAGLIKRLKDCKISKLQNSDGGKSAICGQQLAIEYAIRLGSANATSVIEKIGAKPGILTKTEFEEDERWKNLLIREKTV